MVPLAVHQLLSLLYLKGVAIKDAGRNTMTPMETTQESGYHIP